MYLKLWLRQDSSNTAIWRFVKSSAKVELASMDHIVCPTAPSQQHRLDSSRSIVTDNSTVDFYLHTTKLWTCGLFYSPCALWHADSHEFRLSKVGMCVGSVHIQHFGLRVSLANMSDEVYGTSQTLLWAIYLSIERVTTRQS